MISGLPGSSVSSEIRRMFPRKSSRWKCAVPINALPRRGGCQDDSETTSIVTLEPTRWFGRPTRGLLIGGTTHVTPQPFFCFLTQIRGSSTYKPCATFISTLPVARLATTTPSRPLISPRAQQTGSPTLTVSIRVSPQSTTPVASPDPIFAPSGVCAGPLVFGNVYDQGRRRTRCPMFMARHTQVPDKTREKYRKSRRNRAVTHRGIQSAYLILQWRKIVPPEYWMTEIQPNPTCGRPYAAKYSTAF